MSSWRTRSSRKCAAFAAYEDPALVAELADDPELEAEIVKAHGHALALDRMVRERLGA